MKDNDRTGHKSPGTETDAPTAGRIPALADQIEAVRGVAPTHPVDMDRYGGYVGQVGDDDAVVVYDDRNADAWIQMDREHAIADVGGDE